MDTLAELGILIRQKICLHAFISYLPFFTAVRRLINSAGRDRDLNIVRVLVVGNDRVQAETAKAGRPFLAMRRVPQTFI